jgi:hypothetical protein
MTVVTAPNARQFKKVRRSLKSFIADLLRSRKRAVLVCVDCFLQLGQGCFKARANDLRRKCGKAFLSLPALQPAWQATGRLFKQRRAPKVLIVYFICANVRCTTTSTPWPGKWTWGTPQFTIPFDT